MPDTRVFGSLITKCHDALLYINHQKIMSVMLLVRLHTIQKNDLGIRTNLADQTSYFTLFEEFTEAVGAKLQISLIDVVRNCPACLRLNTQRANFFMYSLPCIILHCHTLVMPRTFRDQRILLLAQ